ncbi:MAG: CPBP family intramembrane glutamic endopeptidase [Patescibacteria group bacterium]
MIIQKFSSKTYNLIINVVIFWIIAFVYSFISKAIVPKDIAQFIYPRYNVLSYGLGPSVGVLVVYLLSRLRNQEFVSNSFFGTDRWWKSVLIITIPITSMIIVDYTNLIKIGLIGTSILIYCVGEEIGWRGWLQPNLEKFFSYKPVYATIITAILWLFWHLAFQPITPLFVILIVAGSFGIGLATEKTNSILVASAMHSVINLLEFSPYSLIITIPVWVMIFRSWKSNK